MLSPEYLDIIEFNDVVELYNKLNIEITADIIQRIADMKEITATTKNELEILKQTNGSDIFNEALEKTSLLTTERKKALRELFEDMAKEDLQGYKELYMYRDKPFKLSETQYKILNQGLKATNKTLKNLTNSIAFQGKQTYVEAVDLAYMQASSGAFDYNSAISNAVQKLADEGITLRDKLGRKVQLEVAVRRNVLSGIHETANNINRDIEKNLGCDGYEVTAHLGARPSHAEKQGKQFAVTKEDAAKYGLELWSDVEELWQEYNCRHTYFGIILGISEPIYSDKELKEYKNANVKFNGKEIPYYEATQKQRQLENTIRKQKRTVQTLEKAGQDTKIAKTKLAIAQKKLNDYCKETGLEKDYSRVNVAKYNSTNEKKYGTISQNTNKEENKLRFIGKIDKNKIGEYANKITTEDIVLTDERKGHILEDHKSDYETIMKNIDRVVLNPNEVLEDAKNKDTLFFIDKLEKNNLNVIVKLNTTNNEEHPQNSIMTAWIIRDRNLKKLEEKNKTIYKKE